MMQKNKFLLVFVIIFYFIAILGNIIDQYVSFLSWADELSAILLFVLYINKFKKLDRYDRKILKLLFLFFIVEGGNLAASKIRNLECPSYEICLIDYGCGKFNRKIHIMEQYP